MSARQTRSRTVGKVPTLPTLTKPSALVPGRQNKDQRESLAPKNRVSIVPPKTKTPQASTSVSQEKGPVATGEVRANPVVKTPQSNMCIPKGTWLQLSSDMEQERLAWFKSNETRLTKFLQHELISLFKKQQDVLYKVVDENTRLSASLGVYQELVKRSEPTSYAGAAKSPAAPGVPAKVAKRDPKPKTPKESVLKISLKGTYPKMKEAELRSKILSVVQPRERKMKSDRIRVDEKGQSAIVRTRDEKTMDKLIGDQAIAAQATVAHVPKKPPSLMVYMYSV